MVRVTFKISGVHTPESASTNDRAEEFDDYCRDIRSHKTIIGGLDLLQFYAVNKCVICRKQFNHTPSRRPTWFSKNCKMTNQIDCTLTKAKRKRKIKF